MNSFQNTHSIELRKNEANKIIFKYPTRIPVIVEKHISCQLKDISKKKYLVPNDLTMNQFIYIIRKKIELKPSESLFITINDHLAPSTLTLAEIYHNDKNDDGFLYMIYTSENTFG